MCYQYHMKHKNYWRQYFRMYWISWIEDIYIEIFETVIFHECLVTWELSKISMISFLILVYFERRAQESLKIFSSSLMSLEIRSVSIEFSSSCTYRVSGNYYAELKKNKLLWTISENVELTNKNYIQFFIISATNDFWEKNEVLLIFQEKCSVLAS